MTNTFEIISALPVKGFDWTAFRAALRAQFVEQCGRNIAAWCNQNALAEFDNATGMREIRRQAVYMAVSIVSHKSTRSNVIPPSQESAAWDSFEGGHHDVWTDAEIEARAIAEIGALAEGFLKSPLKAA